MGLRANVVYFFLFQGLFFFLQVFIFYPCYQIYNRETKISDVNEYYSKHGKNRIKDEPLPGADKAKPKSLPTVNHEQYQNGKYNQHEKGSSKEKEDDDNVTDRQNEDMKMDDGAKVKEKIEPDAHYKPTWESLEQRPVPVWFQDAKIGIFIHWGVFSVPSFVGTGTKGYAEWFWLYWRDPLNYKSPPALSVQEYVNKTYAPTFKYTDFASKFKAEFYDPNHWAEVFKASGARYVVLTSKHHEGYTLWKSKYSNNWNAEDIGPRRNLIDGLSKAVKEKTNLKFGLYYSLYEWFNPRFEEDMKGNFSSQEYVAHKVTPDLHTLVNTYKPEIVWADGYGKAPSSYWNATNFIAWLYNKSPVKNTVVTNDRWGTDAMCKHGGYLTCSDRFNPGKHGHKMAGMWENCMTIDKESWGYRRNARFAHHFTMPELLLLLAQTISYGGNLLMNIGPTADGMIPPLQEERLLELGSWLRVNREAVYGTRACHQQQDQASKSVYFTCKEETVYGIITKWPDEDKLHLASPKHSKSTKVTLLGYSEALHFEKSGGATGLAVILPSFTPSSLPCKWAWVLLLDGVNL